MTDGTATGKVESLLGEVIHCTLDDGRSVTGTFHCLDRLSNLILTNALERRIVSSSDYSDTTDEMVNVSRKLSQVMIPGERLKTVEIAKSLFDAKIQNASNNDS